MKKLKQIFVHFKKKVIEKKHQISVFAITVFVVTATTINSYANDDTYVAKSFLDDEVTSMLVNIGADLVKTVLALVVMLVPVGLTLWGIGFGVKKGLGMLKKNASKAIG